jgi:hypothetical protein
MSKSERQIWTGVGLLLAAGWLLSNPRCSRGCRTMAQHLAEHGIDDFLTGLLGA